MKLSLHRFTNKTTFIYLGLIALFTACESRKTPKYGDGAIAPENALATFDLEPGFKIELIAAEPLVADPVDMEIDEYGRLYVVEMHGYPLDKSRTGRIMRLEDTDGDGVMDESKVFMDGLMFPNGIMRWKEGFIITDAPNVYYIEDSDNDGKVDKQETLLTGFSLSNPHVNVNNPMLGLDNWIYLAHFGAIGTRNYEAEFGDKGTEVYFADQPDGPRLPKNAGGRSVRFRPSQKVLEMTSSRAQFGQTFDAWGHRLLANNGNHAYHEVIDNRYLERNPNLSVTQTTQSTSDHGDVSEVFPTTLNPERQMFSGVGVMTSSSGVTAYLGGAFPAPFNDSITFVAESVSNLVHIDRLHDDGATFIASRTGRSHKEFLSSTDAWSRPVNMYVGPDGALYVLDYYRKIIEHPEWMSEEAVKEGGLYEGKNMGRIYRISATDAPQAAWTKGLSLGDATVEELVAYLADKNNWWRMNAQRLLVDRLDKTAIPALVQMANNKDSPMGRLHARWTLEGMGALSTDVIITALKDPLAGNRENAVKLAELHLGESPELEKDLLSLQDDPDAKVRFQLLCTLGGLNSPASALVRNKLLFKDLGDPWIQVAALSASSLQPQALLAEAIARFPADTASYASLVERLASMIGATGESETIHQLIGKATAVGTASQSRWQAPILVGLREGLGRKGGKTGPDLTGEQPVLMHAFFHHPHQAVQRASFQLIEAFGIKDNSLAQQGIGQAAKLATDRDLPAERRAGAIRFMAIRNPIDHITFLETLMAPEEPLAVQSAALYTYSKVPGTGVSDFILKQWPVMTPDVRDAALTTFMSDPDRVALLLDAIEKGTIQKTSLGWPRTSRLMNQADEALRKRARELLMKDDGEEVNKKYEKALTLKGDPVEGKAVFVQNCSLCHQVRGELGVPYGPDLGTIHNWLPKNIMANILAPGLSVAAGFDLWEVEMKGGEKVQGLLTSESSSAITLLIAPGVDKVFNRQDIQSLKALNTSAMPMNLSEQIDQQQMADLIAFLRENR